MSRLVALRDARTMARGWRWGRRPLAPAGVSAPDRSDREFPTGWARRPAGRAVREVVQRVGLRPLVAAEVSCRVEGLDVLDGLQPPVLFLANHASHLDTALVLCALPGPWRQRTAVAAAADYFFDTWWRAVGSALVFNTFPLQRRGGPGRDRAGEMVAAGWNVLVFPEGSRSADGWLGRLRPGAAYLAAGSALPVVPVALRGTYAAMPRGRAWPAPGRPPVGVRFGPPVHPLPGEEPRALGVRLHSALTQLLDEDATSWWEATSRSARGEASEVTGPPAADWRRRWAATDPQAAAHPVRAGERPRPWRP